MKTVFDCLMLYAIGAILAYTAAFSYPYHSDDGKNEENEEPFS